MFVAEMPDDNGELQRFSDDVRKFVQTSAQEQSDRRAVTSVLINTGLQPGDYG